jgi:TRAP-type C4-dicarboxylate transport system substrate-binding protein
VSRVRTVVVLAAAAALAGCSAGAADKAGGPQAPTVLTVGDSDSSDQPDTAALRHFAAQVDKLSHGSLRIHIAFQAAGAETPYVEERVIRAVQAGRFDLGWVGARAWDEVGIKSFTALQAPFLITSKRLLDRVASSGIATEMLASLSGRRVVGLALVPDYLRHPIGITHKLAAPADFAGARIRIQPSRVTASLMRSLGAVPVEISNQQIGYAIGGKRVDGEELSLQNAVSPAIMSANVTFFGKALTLFANQKGFERLSDDQKRILRGAAAETVGHVAAHYPPDAAIVNSTCQNRRRIVLATAGERAALLRLSQPVYRMLEADPQTRRFIEQIRAWKRTTPADPAISLASPCKHTQPVAGAPGVPRPASLLDGTYRWVLTLSDARAFWGKVDDPSDLPMLGTAVLRNGTWRFVSPEGDDGTFSIRGDRLRFVWPRIPSILVFRYTRDTDGTIHLKPVLPMDRGDQFVWSFKPWKRIGPPTRPGH